ncbi:MAG: MFS transporter [Burkholderiales bacterium]|nr:MFS transporter [Burkholderiales bacterium]
MPLGAPDFCGCNIYSLGLALVIPLSGWMGDKFGTKKIFVISLILFSIGLMMCGLSTSIEQLIFWRLIQGLGGGLLIPVGQTMAYRVFPKVERAKLTTVVMAVAAIAPAISPTIGGFIIEHFSWHFIFFFSVPFTLITLLLSIVWLREEKIHVEGRIDLFGMILVSAGLVFVIYGLSYFKKIQDLTNSLTYLGGGLILLAIFTFYAIKIKHPILDIRIMRNKLLSKGMVIYIFVVGGFAGSNLLVIYFFQSVFAVSAVKTGMLMIPYAISVFIALNFVGRYFNRFGPKNVMLPGVIIFALGLILFQFINNPSDYNIAVVAFILLGSGGAIVTSGCQVIALLEIEHNHMGKASTIWNLNRQLCFSLGVAIFIMILTVMLSHHQITDIASLANHEQVIKIFHTCFSYAAISIIIPLLIILSLDNKKILSSIHH